MLRDHLYADEKNLRLAKPETKTLVPQVIDPEVLWSCNTCRACEEECPVMIGYVDKIVKMRRDLVEGRGEVPGGLAVAFRGMETNSNPWNISAMDRANWTDGLKVPAFDADTCDYLLYAGCAASFDNRAKHISASLVKLLNQAGIKYGYLGCDEPCCGDIARRGGSESNYRMMADTLIETFKILKVKKIITPCPHCFNTLSNESPVFGGNWEVVHHSVLLAKLLEEGKLSPRERIEKKVTYHDGCYLGRYNGVYNPPRQILKTIPGLTLTEIPSSKLRSLCCGAGGARYFMEEHAGQRVNELRVDELLAQKSDVLASACPFCMTMLTDGLKSKELYESKGQLDVAELLSISCGLDDRALLR